MQCDPMERDPTQESVPTRCSVTWCDVTLWSKTLAGRVTWPDAMWPYGVRPYVGECPDAARPNAARPNAMWPYAVKPYTGEWPDLMQHDPMRYSSATRCYSKWLRHSGRDRDELHMPDLRRTLSGVHQRALVWVGCGWLCWVVRTSPNRPEAIPSDRDAHRKR